jgi:hypothetical protein
MTLHHSAGEQKSGLAATEHRLTEIALLMRSIFPSLSWDRETLHSPHKNNLHIEFNRKRVVVQFTNRELRSHSRTLRVRALDHRMYAAIGTLFEA